MSLTRSCYLVFLLVTSVSPLFGQVTGIVRDIESGIPLPGAVIRTADETTVSTDNGSFALQADPGSILLVSHLGYLTDSISIDDPGKFLTVFLSPLSYRLNQVVVSSPFLHEKQLSMPSSIAVLNSKELDRADNSSFIEKLNRLSGVYVHKGAMNTSRITIRGMGARTPYATNRIKAYYNEIPLSSGDGTTLLEDIDPVFIQSISLIKGAKSAVYGNGIGGVLLLSGKNYFKEGISGEITLEGGGFNTLKTAAQIHFLKNDFSLSSGYSYVHTDGFRENSTYDRHNAHLFLSLNKKKLELSFLLHGIDVNSFIPSSIDEETFQNAPEKAASNWLSVKGFERYTRVLTGLKANYSITQNLSNTTLLYGSFLDGYESRPFNILDDQSGQVGIKSYVTYKKGGVSLRSGVDYLVETYNWSLYETGGGIQGRELDRYRENRYPFSAFVQADLAIHPKWVWEAGVSYNTVKYQFYDLFNDGGSLTLQHAFEPAVSPFLGLNFALSDRWYLFGSVGHGFSLPSVEETLLPDGQINPDLQPESGINYELGARYQSPAGNLFVDMTTYLMNVGDLLVTKRISEAVFFGENAGKTRHMGFELMGGYRFNRDRRFRFPETRIDLSLTLSENTFTDFVDDGVDYSGKAIPGVPDQSFSTNVRFLSRKDAYLDLQYRYSGAQYINDANTESYPDFHYTAVKAGKTIELNKWSKLEIYAGVNNVLNANYASMILINAPSFGGAAPRYYYPGQPRYLFGGVRFVF